MHAGRCFAGIAGYHDDDIHMALTEIGDSSICLADFKVLVRAGLRTLNHCSTSTQHQSTSAHDRSTSTQGRSTSAHDRFTSTQDQSTSTHDRDYAPRVMSSAPVHDAERACATMCAAWNNNGSTSGHGQHTLAKRTARQASASDVPSKIPSNMGSELTPRRASAAAASTAAAATRSMSNKVAAAVARQVSSLPSNIPSNPPSEAEVRFRNSKSGAEYLSALMYDAHACTHPRTRTRLCTGACT